MKFSLVVTCYNEMNNLRRWKENVMAQTRPPDEIVIVDSESNDGTTDFLQDWAQDDSRVRVIVQKCKPARGHNIGNGLALYDLILSTDMGVRLSCNWCEELIFPFEDDCEVDVVAGNTCIDTETVVTPAARAEYYIENGGFPKLQPGFVPGNRSVAYTKKLWKELGGLPEDLTFYADDSVFGRQIVEGGYNMAFAPKAMTFWARPEKLKQFWREQFVYGRGDGEALIKMPYAFKLYLKGLPFLFVPFLNGLRVMQKQCRVSAFSKAWIKNDLSALVMMPVLAFGNGWNFARGYVVGYKSGETLCAECRRRIETLKI